jgi:hypothetical protein
MPERARPAQTQTHLPQTRPRTGEPSLGALQQRAGNRAMAELLGGASARPIQREEDENPFEPVQTGLDWKDRAEATETLVEHGGEAAGAPWAAAEEAGAFGQTMEVANASVFGPLEVGLGIKDVVQGIRKGGVAGTEQALTGGVGAVGGGASMLAPVLGAAAVAPVAVASAGFGAGMMVGNAGLDESPYDLPGTAADVGEYFDRSGIPGAGLLGTAIGSAAMVPGAAYYGAKRGVKNIGKGLSWAGRGIGRGVSSIASSAYDYFSGNVEAEAPDLSGIPVDSEQIGPSTQTVHEEMPPLRRDE